MKFKNYIDNDIINEGINDKGIFHACFMSGQPGSGKSYVISKINSGSISPRIINTDIMTEFLKKKLGVKTWGDNWSVFSKKIKETTKKQLVLYLNSMLPLWIDGTSSSPSSVFKREGILKSIGYDTSMVWVHTSLETAIERNRKRERNVDEDFLIEVYEKMEKLKSYYKSHFNVFKEVPNDVGELTEEVILDSYKKMTGFFSSPVENPIGKDLVKTMVENKQKYLIDTHQYNIEYINKLTDSWYNS